MVIKQRELPRKKSEHMNLENINISAVQLKENMFTEMVQRICDPTEEVFKRKTELLDEYHDMHNFITEINRFLNKFLTKYHKSLATDIVHQRNHKMHPGTFEEMREEKKIEYLDRRKETLVKNVQRYSNELKKMEDRITEAGNVQTVHSEIEEIKGLVESEKKGIVELLGELRQRQKTFVNIENSTSSDDFKLMDAMAERTRYLTRKNKILSGRIESMKSRLEETKEEIDKLSEEKGPLEKEALELGAKKTEEMKKKEILEAKKEKLKKAVNFLEKTIGKYDDDKRLELLPLSERNSEVLGKIKEITSKIEEQRTELAKLTEYIKKHKEVIPNAKSLSNTRVQSPIFHSLEKKVLTSVKIRTSSHLRGSQMEGGGGGSNGASFLKKGKGFGKNLMKLEPKKFRESNEGRVKTEPKFFKDSEPDIKTNLKENKSSLNPNEDPNEQKEREKLLEKNNEEKPFEQKEREKALEKSKEEKPLNQRKEEQGLETKTKENLDVNEGNNDAITLDEPLIKESRTKNNPKEEHPEEEPEEEIGEEYNRNDFEDKEDFSANT